MSAQIDDSDLFNGDDARDWAGCELDECPEPTSDDLWEWARRAEDRDKA